MEHRVCFGCMRLTTSPVCEHCGFDGSRRNEPHQLPMGTVLMGKYVVGKVLGQGGFGITYLGWSKYYQTRVAIKEYFPSAVVDRNTTRNSTVQCKSTQVEGFFRENRERFLREAQSLVKLKDVSQVVSIYDFFEMNNTAYIVMEYLEGEDLRARMKRQGPFPAGPFLKLIRPIMETLIQVHGADLVHRDISPDNIMLMADGGVKLMDFGAVRNVNHPGVDKELTQATQAIVKHGFAPVEQYSETGTLGPWTDEYALCATIFYCLTGQVPENAPTRIAEDKEMDWDNVPGLTPHQRKVLAKGTATRVKDRYLSIQELMEDLYAEPIPAPAPDPVPEPVPPKPEEKKPEEPGEKNPEAKPEKKKKRLWPAVLAAVLVLLLMAGGAGLWYFSRPVVTSAALDNGTLEKLLEPDCSAIGYYAVDVQLALSETGKVSFPVGDAYNGMEVLVTDGEGTSVTATVEEGMASAKLKPEGSYMLQVKTSGTEQLGWQDWAEELPEGVALNEDTVEADLRYRSREKEYAESYYNNMEGWELLETLPNDKPYGEWSSWDAAKKTSSDTLEVEQEEQFRSRKKETTTSSKKTMDGWTFVQTTYEYEYGAWSAWSETPVQASENLEVRSQTVRYGTYVRRDENGATVGGGTVVVDEYAFVGDGWYEIGDGVSFTCTYTSITTKTTYSSRTKTLKATIHHFYRWSDWSDWSPEPVAEEEGVEMETQTRNAYRSREIYGDSIYRFWRWKDWESWTLTAPGEKLPERDYEKQVVYRYIP